MGQWERRPKADPDPAKNQPVCPGPNGRARTACRVGWAPCWVIGRLEAPPRHLSCGPGWLSISSAFLQPQVGWASSALFFPFFFSTKNECFFFLFRFLWLWTTSFLCLWKELFLTPYLFIHIHKKIASLFHTFWPMTTGVREMHNCLCHFFLIIFLLCNYFSWHWAGWSRWPLRAEMLDWITIKCCSPRRHGKKLTRIGNYNMGS